MTPDEVAASHRWHAVECNNLAWSLSELPSRTPTQDAEMLHAAHAAAFHWHKVGTEENAARASMLLGHVHAALGHGGLALWYAEDSYRYLVDHNPPDWEIAFACAVLAHAAYAAGDAGLHRDNYSRARDLGQAIAGSEDREIFLRTFARIPSP